MASYKYDLEHDLELEEPKNIKYYYLNDDFSTMEFVIEILTKVFRKSLEESEKIMLDVHNNGKAICGIYTKEIALNKSSTSKNNGKKSKVSIKSYCRRRIKYDKSKLQKVFTDAVNYARANNHEYITTEHIFVYLIKNRIYCKFITTNGNGRRAFI